MAFAFALIAVATKFAAVAPLMFLVGMVISLWIHAYGLINSKLRPDIASYGDFWRVLRPIICGRLFVALLLYGVGSMGPSLPADTTFIQRVCFAGLAGFGMDRVLIEGAKRLTFLQGAIPDLPGTKSDK